MKVVPLTEEAKTRDSLVNSEQMLEVSLTTHTHTRLHLKKTKQKIKNHQIMAKLNLVQS